MRKKVKDSNAFKRFVSIQIGEKLKHPVIINNQYCNWFGLHSVNEAQAKDNIEQFAVFSNFFLESQVKRVVRARTVESRREALKILVNELGVPFGANDEVEGQKFSEDDVHFESLCAIGKQLDLDMAMFGTWDIGTPDTHEFIIRLDGVYGSFDPWISAGASFGIEKWAGSYIGDKKLEHKNFWTQHIRGFHAFNIKHRISNGLEPLDLRFFKFHFGLELKHVGSVEKELRKNFNDSKFDEKKFLEGMERALDAIHIFWKGLDATRKTLQ